VRHSLLVTGTKAVSVDAVAASLMGFSSGEIPYLTMAERAGAYGEADLDVIWMRGSEIDEARRAFRKPAEWHPPAPAK
jgi:hypothetical protein